MIVYCVNVAGGEYDAEGEDRSEYFSSLRKAKKRRRELIAEGSDYKYGEDFSIDKIEIRELPKTELVLALLNRVRWAKSIEQAVAAHKKDERFDPQEAWQT